MRSELKIDDSVVAPIVKKLLSQERDAVDSFRTETRREYEILLTAAQKGKFPDLLSMTHRGLRLKKRFVHAPLNANAA